MLYFAIHELNYSEEQALTTSLPRILLLYREHIDINTPQEKKSIVDLFTEETIDKLVKAIKKPVQNKYIPYDDYRPIIKMENKNG